MTLKQKAIVLCVLSLGLLLKFHNYSVYPQRGATSDEYTYSFLGLSLLTRGVPISWSYFGAYKHHMDLTIDRLYFPIVWPYFDHPPLNGILVASWALLNGERTFESIRLETIRLVPVALTTIGSVFLFLYIQSLYGFTTGLLALIIYSTATIMVVSSRVVMAENLLTPLFLFTLWYYDCAKKSVTMRSVLLLGILSGLAFWTKELGIAVALTLTSFAVYDRVKARRIFVVIFVTLASIGGYVSYGYHYDWNVFVSIVTAQATRVIGPQTFWMLTSTPVLINKVFYDGWYMFGFLCLFFCFSDVKRHIRLVLPFFVYFLLLLGSLTKEGEMGWYMIPVYPFMAAGTAVVTRDMLQKPTWITLVMLLIVGMSLIHYGLEVPFGLTQMRFRLLLGVFWVPYILAYLTKRYRVVILLQRVFLSIFFLTTITMTYTYIHPA